MTSKERVLSALNHQQPDKVPMDFGGCTCHLRGGAARILWSGKAPGQDL